MFFNSSLHEKWVVSSPKEATGQARLIRSHSSARFCFELSVNSNYNMKLLSFPLMSDEVISRLEAKLRSVNFELTVSDMYIQSSMVLELIFTEWNVSWVESNRNKNNSLCLEKPCPHENTSDRLCCQWTDNIPLATTSLNQSPSIISSCQHNIQDDASENPLGLNTFNIASLIRANHMLISFDASRG